MTIWLSARAFISVRALRWRDLKEALQSNRCSRAFPACARPPDALQPSYMEGVFVGWGILQPAAEH